MSTIKAALTRKRNSPDHWSKNSASRDEHNDAIDSLFITIIAIITIINIIIWNYR